VRCRASNSGLAALQGSWEQIGFEADGASDTADEFGAAHSITTFTDSHFSVRTADGALLLEGRFELDASCIPKTVNWIDTMGPDQGKVLPAIYTLEGSHFVFIAADEGAPRPCVFRTSAGQTMRTFVRRS
jgi:uncharacterized protein (TIGR03067 family)